MDPKAQAFNDAVAAIKADLGAFVPETILSVFVCLLLLFDLFGRRARPKAAGILAIAGIVLAGVALVLQNVTPAREIFGWSEGSNRLGMMRVDAFGQFFKGLILLGTGIAAVMALTFEAFSKRRMGEFYALLLGAALGMCIMSAATNLLIFYLGVEFSSMASYLLTAFVKRDLKGSEAGMKYAIYGSVSSGVMIFGLSLLYGLTGSLHVTDLARQFMAGGNAAPMLLVAAAMSFAGLAYKMAAFPMHFWCPDVYEGAPTPFTAFLSVASKAAGFALFVRFLLAFGSGYSVTLATGSRVDVNWPMLVMVASVASMTLGNLAALWQTNVKRMLAYSSIAHAGYLLMAVAVLTPGAPPEQAMPLLFYFIAYLFMNLGAFYVVTMVESRTGQVDVDGYRGLGRTAPFLGVCLTVFLLSLIGVPPTGGFTGKLQLFMTVIDHKLYWLAIVAGVNTAISAYYYFRIIKAMYLDEAHANAPRGFAIFPQAVVAALAIPVLWLGLDFNRVALFAAQFGL
jgi:NADH-quinone oxidoreductase subunit N